MSEGRMFCCCALF